MLWYLVLPIMLLPWQLMHILIRFILEVQPQELITLLPLSGLMWLLPLISGIISFIMSEPVVPVCMWRLLIPALHLQQRGFPILIIFIALLPRILLYGEQHH